MTLTYSTYRMLRAELTAYDQSDPRPAHLVAVDFDNLIIHAKTYTWDEWANDGQHNYPSCQPVPIGFIEANPTCFGEFIDMRVYTSIYAK